MTRKTCTKACSGWVAGMGRCHAIAGGGRGGVRGKPAQIYNFHRATGCAEHVVLSSSMQRICTGGMALGRLPLIPKKNRRDNQVRTSSQWQLNAGLRSRWTTQQPPASMPLPATALWLCRQRGGPAEPRRRVSAFKGAWSWTQIGKKKTKRTRHSWRAFFCLIQRGLIYKILHSGSLLDLQSSNEKILAL